MKIIMIECNAEEIKANRTLFDSVSDAVSHFVSHLHNEGTTSEMMAVLHDDDESESEE